MEKGNDDGLFISSVACCQELWALIMDAGTGFNAQASVVSRPIHAIGNREWGLEVSLARERLINFGNVLC